MLACPSPRSSRRRWAWVACWACCGSSAGGWLADWLTWFVLSNQLRNARVHLFLFVLFSLCLSFAVAQVASLRLPVHRDVPDGDGGPRAGRLRCAQHHRVRSRRQGPDLQPHLRPAHHRQSCAHNTARKTQSCPSPLLTLRDFFCLFVSRATASEALWTQLPSSSARRLTAACCPWSSSTR